MSSLFRRKEKGDYPAIEKDSSSPYYLKPSLNFKKTTNIREFPFNSIFKRIKWRLLLILLFGWLLVINYYERSVVRRSMNQCGWHKWEKWEKGTTPHRIALIADPQLVDDYSYPNNPAMINKYIKKISDNYLHRNYRYIQELLDPDTTIFLGDLFDGGRDWEDETWFEEYSRFGKIFPKKPNRVTINSLPGNHDIGFEGMSLKVSGRFETFFGEPNDIFILGNHSIVQIDTISLSHQNPSIKQDSLDFLKSINEQLNPHYPRIILTHVPLWRFNDKQLCGPLRESKKKFPIQKGKQYQTAINNEISQEILKTVNPSIVFGGDDHDYCHIEHAYSYNGVNTIADEITVKSFAMTSGIKKPAFQLLSLYNPNPNSEKNKKDTYRTKMCYLPMPYHALNMYILALALTVGSIIMTFGFPNKLGMIEQLLNSSLASIEMKRNNLPVYEGNTWKSKQINWHLNEGRDVTAIFVNSFLLLIGVYTIFGLYYSNI